MKQFFLGVAVMVTATHSSYAQRVEATVVDAQSREPIAYASVGVVERNLGTLTDTTGRFLSLCTQIIVEAPLGSTLAIDVAEEK